MSAQPITDNIICPICNGTKTKRDFIAHTCSCEFCGTQWNDSLYVKVEFPDDSSLIEDTDACYPSYFSVDNGAIYVPEYEYLRVFHKKPNASQCYIPVTWPDSQKYMEEESGNYEFIYDEKGLEDFGSSAMWIQQTVIER